MNDTKAKRIPQRICATITASVTHGKFELHVFSRINAMFLRDNSVSFTFWLSFFLALCFNPFYSLFSVFSIHMTFFFSLFCFLYQTQSLESFEIGCEILWHCIIIIHFMSFEHWHCFSYVVQKEGERWDTKLQLRSASLYGMEFCSSATKYQRQWRFISMQNKIAANIWKMMTHKMYNSVTVSLDFILNNTFSFKAERTKKLVFL